MSLRRVTKTEIGGGGRNTSNRMQQWLVGYRSLTHSHWRAHRKKHKVVLKELLDSRGQGYDLSNIWRFFFLSLSTLRERKREPLVFFPQIMLHSQKKPAWLQLNSVIIQSERGDALKSWNNIITNTVDQKQTGILLSFHQTWTVTKETQRRRAAAVTDVS